MAGLFETNPFRGATLATAAYEAQKLAVWAKGKTIPGRNPSEYRHDAYGWIIEYSQYGNRESAFGWEFDHYPVPASLGGADDISNLRPLNWRMNCAISNNGGRRGLLSR